MIVWAEVVRPHQQGEERDLGNEIVTEIDEGGDHVREDAGTPKSMRKLKNSHQFIVFY